MDCIFAKEETTPPPDYRYEIYYFGAGYPNEKVRIGTKIDSFDLGFKFCMETTPFVVDDDQIKLVKLWI